MSVEELHTLNVWLVYYNAERPYQAYCNLSKRPLDTNLLVLPGWRGRRLTAGAISV